MTYEEFIKNKHLADVPTGIANAHDLPMNEMLFDFQRDIVRWALKRGRACIWAECGLGKTAMELEWGKHVAEFTKMPVLILAPLAVSEQTANIEAPKFGYQCHMAVNQSQILPGINITNYEKLDKFDLSQVGGIILDESSILKNYAGKIRNNILSQSASVPFRLACTATPSPNDYMELGNHAEFVGAMKYSEMLATFFVHDNGNTSQWRLKGHAKKTFFSWVASWAVFIRKPSDIGYSDDKFVLPPIVFHDVIVQSHVTDDSLFPMTAMTLHERQLARKSSISDRIDAAVKIIEDNKKSESDQFCVWCNLNAESDGVAAQRTSVVNIQGSDSNELKTANMLGFARGDVAEIVSKPKIAGFGLNWQRCNKVIFLGLSDSYEQFYQAVRRFYRYGQQNTVHVWIVTAETEGAVVANINRKNADANAMYAEMVKHMCVDNRNALHEHRIIKEIYNPKKKYQMPNFLKGAQTA